MPQPCIPSTATLINRSAYPLTACSSEIGHRSTGWPADTLLLKADKGYSQIEDED